MIGGWGEYLLVWALFMASHAIPSRPALKARLVAVLGQRGYILAYSALSVVLLLWLFRAAGSAPYVELWPMPEVGPWLVLFTMTVALMILALGLFRPNPFSFGGSQAAFDPARPGILRWVRHPILTAALLWSLAHLVVNGDLAHVALFGGFAIFSLFGMRMIDRRNRRRMGEGVWLAAVQSLRSGSGLPDHLLLRVVAGLLALVALIFLHPHIAGVAIGHWFH